VGGVITTDQRIAPAGIQTVFEGRVEGVSFGAGDDELLVLVEGNRGAPSAVWRVGWRENQLRGRSPLPGSGAPGLQGIRLDPVGGRSVISYVGSSPRAARLAILSGDSLKTLTDALGRTEVGAAAIARARNTEGRRIAAVPLSYDNQLAVVDAGSGALLRKAPTGIAPFGAAIDSTGSVAYVTNWGGRQPRDGDTTAKAGDSEESDEVVVDARGIASTATVTRIDLLRGVATHTIPVDLHPTAIVWDEGRGRVYVAAGNADAVTVIDSRTNEVAQRFRIAPFRDATPGLAPTALVLSPDGGTLYVALGGINAVAVLDAASGALKGLIPTAWYPGSIALSRDGKTLAVGAMLGVGSGTLPADREDEESGMIAGKGYVHSYRGAVNVIPVPGEAELAAYTVAVAANAGLRLASGSGERLLLPARTGIAARAVPERPGEPSAIDHVVYIIKENRTYDQLFGDIAKGNGDPSLTIYGDSISTNHHRLAEQFVLLDNFYATGGNSGDGHQWVTQANESDYAMWGFTGRSYPFNGTDPIAPVWGGFLWDAALAAGKSVMIFGEYAGNFRDPALGNRVKNLAAFRAGESFAGRIHQVAPNRRVDSLLAHEYPGWSLAIPDVVRAQLFAARLAGWERDGDMPNLVIVHLPSDHTSGTSPGTATPAAYVADNDLALGRVVDGLSHSRFWPSMAIFVVEDDAQAGVDHVDGHRTVALAISPYIRRGSVDHTFYAQQSILKTIELMLGLHPMSVFDLTASSLTASFLGPGARPDLTPYTAVEPKQSIYEVNPPASALRGPARAAALASTRMDFANVDAAPTETLNRILWHVAKGWETPYPEVRHSVFFPMSLDLADEERE
jgi:hypothetical protein